MREKLIEVTNATVVPTVSMALITGKQTAKNTLEGFWNSIYSIVPYPSVDIYALTTGGQYQNIAKGPSYFERQLRLHQMAKFQRQWHSAIRTRFEYDHIIVPQAYSVASWDGLVQHESFVGPYVHMVGYLKSAYDSNRTYKELLHELAEARGRLCTRAQVSFWNEEYAQSFAMAAQIMMFPLTERSLRRDTSGPVFRMYPGPLEKSEVMGLRLLSRFTKQKIKPRKAYYVDVSDLHDPVYIDLAQAVEYADLTPGTGPHIQY